MEYDLKKHVSVQDRQCTYKGEIDAPSRSHCCRGRATSITDSEFVSVAFVTQHTSCVRPMTHMLSSMARLLVPYVSTMVIADAFRQHKIVWLNKDELYIHVQMKQYALSAHVCTIHSDSSYNTQDSQQISLFTYTNCYTYEPTSHI